MNLDHLENQNNMDLDKIVSKRLSILFENEVQDVTASKLNVGQGTISKWINGQQMPTTDMLHSIAKTYNVSIDWILGISDIKEINGFNIKEISYKQVLEILDYLIKMNIIEIPDLIEVANTNNINTNDSEMYDDIDEELEQNSIYNPDILKINDRLVSHMMNRRQTLINMDAEMYDVWKDKLKPFSEVTLIENNSIIQEIISLSNIAQLKDGDWVELISRLQEMDEIKLNQYRKELKEKDGKNNG